MNLSNLASRTPLDSGPLPSWFVRPAATQCRQGHLFLESRDDVLGRLRVSLDDVCNWHEHGWLPFDPSKVEDLDPDQVGTLIFVRNAARSGMPRALLQELFRELPSLYLPDPTCLAYSFTFGWVEGVPPPEPDAVIAEHLEDWLGLLAETGEVDRLETLAARIEELLQEANKDAQDSGDRAE